MGLVLAVQDHCSTPCVVIYIYIYLQDGQDILLGSGANLTAEQALMNLGNTTIPS